MVSTKNDCFAIQHCRAGSISSRVFTNWSTFSDQSSITVEYQFIFITVFKVIGRLNSGIFGTIKLSAWNINLNSSDCRATKIMKNDTKFDKISWELSTDTWIKRAKKLYIVWYLFVTYMFWGWKLRELTQNEISPQNSYLKRISVKS